MEWSEKQILDTLRLIEASDYDDVKLEAGDFKLHVRKRGAPATEPERPASVAPPPRPTETQPIGPTPVPPGSSALAPAASEAHTRVDPAPPPGMIAIRSPVIGTFYRAPAPHAAPFVDPGASVGPDDTVCLIEVMKLFSTIKAGIAGTVVKVLAQNATTVKKDDVLFWIQPSGQ